MNTSSVGQKHMTTLAIKADTLYESKKGEWDYKYAEPYGTIKDEFTSIVNSPDTTDDEKSIAKLGLLLNDSWLPDGGLNRADILNAHRGLLETAEKEYENPSGNKIGAILANATLNAINTTLSLSGPCAALREEAVTAVFLGDGFEAIMSSKATKKEKSLAKKGIKNTTDYVYKGELPLEVMNNIAGKNEQ